MRKSQFSTKRLLINKANATIVGAIAGAVFVTVFSLVSCKALLGQRAYQARVIGKKQVALDQLKSNVEAVNGLVVAYKDFTGAPDNVIGGNPLGSGEKDGDNAKIVLDALPSKYDFPAVATSLEKILTDKKFKIDVITGTDDELAQSSAVDSATPKPVDIPFQLGVTGSYTSLQDLVGVFEKSIRPFQMQKLSFSGSNDTMQAVIGAKTFYQPEKGLSIKLETVK